MFTPDGGGGGFNDDETGAGGKKKMSWSTGKGATPVKTIDKSKFKSTRVKSSMPDAFRADKPPHLFWLKKITLKNKEGVPTGPGLLINLPKDGMSNETVIEAVKKVADMTK